MCHLSVPVVTAHGALGATALVPMLLAAVRPSRPLAALRETWSSSRRMRCTGWRTASAPSRCGDVRRARHASRSRSGAYNAPVLWVWSPQPVHEPLIPQVDIRRPHPETAGQPRLPDRGHRQHPSADELHLRATRHAPARLQPAHVRQTPQRHHQTTAASPEPTTAADPTPTPATPKPPTSARISCWTRSPPSTPTMCSASTGPICWAPSSNAPNTATPPTPRRTRPAAPPTERCLPPPAQPPATGRELPRRQPLGAMPWLCW